MVIASLNKNIFFGEIAEFLLIVALFCQHWIALVFDQRQTLG